MNQIESAPDAQEAVPSKPFLSRLVGIFIEPGETFEDIARKPDILAPLIFLVLVTLSVTETMLAKIGMSRIILSSLTQSGQASRLSSEQLQQAIQRGAAIGGIVVQISAALSIPFFMLLVAGFGILVLNGFFGAQAKFKEIFSATCYAYMPSILGAVMAVAVMFFGDADHFNVKTPAPTNLAFFMNPLTTSPAVYSIASSLDIIIFWFMILLAIGLSRVSRNKVKSSTVFMTFFGAWIIVVLVRVGFAMLV